jgi:tetratricopeptide (TPR) repeat protein
MTGHSTQSSLEVAKVTDPAALLGHAQNLEPLGLYAERKATLARVQDLLDAGNVAPAPPGRDWRIELIAEQAVDATREQAPGGRALVDQVLSEADPVHKLARGRALLAGGQERAWEGTDTATVQARREFLEAASIFAALGHRDWQGSALLRCGFSAHYQYGDLIGAEELISRALEAYESSERRAAALAYYSDVLIDLGEFDRAEQILAEAAVTAEQRDDRRSIPDISSGVRGGSPQVAATRAPPSACCVKPSAPR